MITPAITLALVGLASASSLTCGALTPIYPTLSSSMGFNLVINVTETSHADFSHDINHKYVTSYHTGAGTSIAGVIVGESKNVTSHSAPIFYQNGTAGEARCGMTSIITDGGEPVFPEGLQLVQNKTSDLTAAVALNAGPGTPGFGVSHYPEPYRFLEPGNFYACNTTLPYSSDEHFIAIHHASTTVDCDGMVDTNVPAGCVAIRLMPQCATLPTLPKGSISSHEFAIESECYRDVGRINWSDYGS